MVFSPLITNKTANRQTNKHTFIYIYIDNKKIYIKLKTITKRQQNLIIDLINCDRVLYPLSKSNTLKIIRLNSVLSIVHYPGVFLDPKVVNKLCLKSKDNKSKHTIGARKAKESACKLFAMQIVVRCIFEENKVN